MKRNIWRIAREEWSYHHHNAIHWMALYVLPIVLSLLIFLIYRNHVLLEMPTVVVNQDKSISSLRLGRMLDQHRFLRITETTDRLEQGLYDLRTRKAYVLVIIPREFEKQWKKGQQPVIRSFSYGTNLVIGKSIQRAIVETTGQMSGEIEAGKLIAMRHESVNLKRNYPLLNLSFHNLYNPGYNYQWFLPPGAIISIFQMMIVMLGAMAFCKRKRSLEIIPGKDSFFSMYVGKLIPVLIVYTFQGLLLWLVLFPLLQIPVRGNLFVGFMLWEFFIIACYSMGYAISAMIKDSMISTVVSVFIMAPAFAFSGYTYPYWEMPLLHRIFALAMPTTHFLPSFLQFYLQGSSLNIMFPKLLHILIFMFCLSMLLFTSRAIHHRYPNGWER